MNQYNSQIGTDIKRIRTSLGLTQKAFAGLFNSADDGLTTSRTDVNKYERGKVPCPGDKYLKFLSLEKKEI